MLERIDMDVINMPREIILVANGVLPIAPLPNAAFAFGGASVRNAFAGRRLRDKADLIRRQRGAKCLSAAGSVQIAWRRSASTATASIVNGYVRRVSRNTSRKRRSVASATAAPALRQIIGKKEAAPARKLRRMRSCRQDPMVARRQYGAVAFTVGSEAEPSVLLDQVMG